MKKITGLWMLPVLLMPVLTHGQGISVHRVNDTAIVSDPGKIITLVFRITHTGTGSFSLSPQLILPQGWTPVTETGEFSVYPGTSQIQLVSFSIPPLAPTGDYRVDYLLMSDREVLYAKQLDIHINKKNGLVLDLIQSEPYVRAGEVTVSRYVVRNRSNAPQTIAITAVNGQVDGPGSFMLESDSSRIVQISSPTLSTLTENSLLGVRVRASVTDMEGGSVERFHQVKIIPVLRPEYDLYRRFPVTASLTSLIRYRNETVASGFQGEIYGTGVLDPTGKHQLEFRLRGPNRFNLSVLGQYDEYFATYYSKNLKVTVGDHNYALTPLTENSRYGRGVRVTYTNKHVETGGFYNQPRFLPDVSRVYAGYFHFHFSGKNKIGLQYLHKKYNENLQAADIISLTTTLEPFRYSKLYAEVSKGFQGDKSGYGVHVGFDLRASKFSISTFAIYAGKDYPGYYTNTTTYSGNLTYQVVKKLVVLGYVRHDDRNASRDTLFGISPIRRDFRAGLAYSLGTSGTLRGYAGYISSEDRAEKKQFYYDEKYLRLEYTQSLNRFTVDVSSDFGATRNHLFADDPQARSFRAQAHLGYRPSVKFSVGGFAALSRDNRYSDQVENTWYYGLDLNANLSSTTNLSFRIQNNYSIEEYYRDRSLLDLRFSQRFLRNHEITLTGQYALVQKHTDESDMSVGITYSYRINVPMKKVAEPGMTVSGQVENLGAGSVKGIILQLNGYTTTTDENGFFVFYNVKPGIYYLVIDKTSIRLTEIPDVQIPIMVVVEPGRDNFIRFGMTTAATVKGKLHFNGNGATPIPGTSQDPSGSNQLIVEMKSDQEVIRKVTDPFGSYEFTNLRPGQWTMKVYANGLAKDYQLKQTEYQLELKPGDILDIPVILKKKERIIKFVEQPGIISYKK
ncbi:MAG: carboxypeptidase-like regulatory domain-containing protein [Bacteroidales bacterium]|nr:carboxypeptidase-like regulatory domain-containing protein [Bacteroidales bacterium]